MSRAAIEESAAEHYSPAQRAAWSARRTVAAHARFIEVTTVLVAEVDGAVAGFASVALAPPGRIRRPRS